jgi:flagellar biosynthesis/type III secretory pathway protein FliH
MGHETSIRLPGRLVGIVRTDAAAPSAVGAPQLPAPLAGAVTENLAVDVRPSIAAKADQPSLQRVLAALSEATAALQSHHRQLVQAVQPLAVELAAAVAGRFLLRTVELGEFPFVAWIRQALERLGTRHSVLVLLHPEDLALLQQRLGAEARAFELADASLAADPALGRGCFRVQVQDCSVRFDLDNRLEALRQHLLDSLSSSAALAGATPPV